MDTITTEYLGLTKDGIKEMDVSTIAGIQEQLEESLQMLQDGSIKHTVEQGAKFGETYDYVLYLLYKHAQDYIVDDLVYTLTLLGDEMKVRSSE